MKKIFYIFTFTVFLLISKNSYSLNQEIQDLYDKAVELEMLERYDEAIEMFNKVIIKDPKDIPSLYGLGNLYIKLGKIDEAVSNLSKILNIDSANAQALSRLGLAYIQKGDNQTAIRYLNQAIAIKSDLPDVQINFCKLYYAEKSYKKAIVYGKKAIWLDSNLPEAFLVTGMAYSKNKQYRDAVRQFIKVIEIDHNSSYAEVATNELESALNELKEINSKVKNATDFYNEKKNEESKKMFLEILKDDPYNSDAYYGLATIASFVDQNNDEAVILFKKSISNNPNYVYGYSGLALIYLTTENVENIRYVTNRIRIININQKMFLSELDKLRNFLSKLTEKKKTLEILFKAYDLVEYGEAYGRVKKLNSKLESQQQALKYYQSGIKYQSEKNYKQALDEYKTALQLYPNFKRLKEKWSQTLDELRSSVVKKGNDPEGYYLLASTARQENKFDEAEKEYMQALEMDPNFKDSPGAHYWLGIIYKKQKRYDQARQKFELVLDKNVEYLKNNYLLLDTYWNLGNVYNNLSKFDEAIQTLEKAIQRDSRWEYLYMDLASIYLNKKQYKQAIEQIKFVLKKSPGEISAENTLKEVYIQMGYKEQEIQKQFKNIYDQIIVELENEKRGSSFLKNYSLALGKAYLANKEYGKAINELNIYLDKFPGDKKVELQLLSIYRELNYTPSEIAKLELRVKKALLAEEYFNKGNELYYKNKFKEALESFIDATKSKENNIIAMIRIGDCYANLKKFDEAINQYKAVLDIDPGLYEVYSNRAYIYNMQKKYDKAIEECEKAIKISLYYPNSYNNLGYAYMMKKKYSQALRQFEKAIELVPDYSSAIRNLEKTKKILAKESK